MSQFSNTALCKCGCGLPAPVADRTDRKEGWVEGEPRPYRQGHHPRANPVALEQAKAEYKAERAERGVAWSKCFCGCGLPTPISDRNYAPRFLIRGWPIRFRHGHAGRRNPIKAPSCPITDSPKYKAAKYREWWEANTDVPFGYCWCGCGQRTRIAERTTHRENHLEGQPQRFIDHHHRRLSPVDYIEEDRGYETPCWIWQRSFNIWGYGLTSRNGVNGQAHRRYYEEHVGPVPDNLPLDHLCRVRACVNPSHVEPVTQAENARRGNGSKLSVENVLSIRALLAQKQLSQQKIAEQFGVSRGAIDAIVRGRTWKDVR